jgi:hypothetical protein
MPPPKSEAPISSPANLEARPTVTQEVIVIDSDESDHAGVMEISASRETTHPLTSLHSQSRGDGSLTSTVRMNSVPFLFFFVVIPPLVEKQEPN